MADTVGPDLNAVEGNRPVTSGNSQFTRSSRCRVRRRRLALDLRECQETGRGRGLMSLDDRKLEVLRAIVEDYVETQEPVGSKALVERHQLGVSSATVRNDMAGLEEEGYIRQAHTSGRRVATHAAYPLFRDPA